MKKVGGTRASSARASVTAPREPWRKWVLTLLALGFALLVITLLMKQNKMLIADVQNATKLASLSEGEKTGVQDMALPLSYSIESVPANVYVSTAGFSDYSAADLAAMADECGTAYEAGHFESVASALADTEKITYTFSYNDPSQDGNYVVTLVPNAMHYTALADFQKDFDICAAGGDLYPHAVSEDWLMFTNSCGSGYDDDSGLPHGCEIMRTAIEPTLQLL